MKKVSFPLSIQNLLVSEEAKDKNVIDTGSCAAILCPEGWFTGGY